MAKLKVVTLMALLIVAGVCPAAAQETRGSIEGVVKDASGGVLPGVTVEAKNQSGATSTAVTDDRGVYRFPALPVGTYTVTASLDGFNQAVRSDILLTLGQQLRVELVMTVGSLTESVNVTAETPIVDVKRNSVSTTMTDEVIDLIPKDRDFLSAITGIPGTNNVARAGGIMIDGATSTENRYVVDGVDTTSLDTGDSGKRVIIDFVEQIQVQRSGYNAEFRAATGGVISAITKSGTNSYRGEVGLNYSGPTLNRTLQGKVRPSLQISTVDDQTLEYVYPVRLHEESNFEPVFQFSGPILRDRMWFFVGVAPERETQTREVTWANPNPNGPQTQEFQDKEKNDQYNYTVTTQLSGNTRLRFNGSHGRSDPGLSVPSIDAGTGISTANPLNFNPQPTIRTFGASDTYSGSLDWTATEKTFVNFTAGWYQTNSYSDGGEPFTATRRTFANSSLTYEDVPEAFRRSSGFAENPVNTFNDHDAFDRLNLNADVTTYRRWKGEHSIKIGAQYERLSNSVNIGQQYANISFNWNRSYQPAAGGDPVRGTYGYYLVSRSYTSGDVSSHNVGLFVQDQWSVNNRLTFNVGLRTDRTHMPSYRPENPSLDFSFGDKIAPRVGAAYDMRGDGRWKLYGSWGVFYDIEKLEMPRGLWGADHWVQYYYTLDTFDWQNVDCGDINGETGCPGTLIERLDRRHVSNDAENLLVDSNLKPMRSQEATIGLDHELSQYSSIGVRYTHKWLNRAIEDVGVIDPEVGAEIFFIANPGEGIGEFPLGPDYPATPKAKRVYDGFDISYNRRLHNNWSLNTSVVISRLWGNYTGLSNGQSESGRQSPNVTRAFDGLFMSYDANGKPTYGRMGTDIPFQFKALATYVMPWGTSVGVDQRVQSGLLHTTSINYQSVPVPVYGYGDLGRTPTFSQTNLLFGHTFRLPGSTRLNVQLNVNNLFDQDTVTAFDTTPYLNGSLSFPLLPDGSPNHHLFFAGFDPRANMAAVNAKTPTLANPDPRYGNGMGTSFQGARSVRVYARFQF
ncbi:MAG TPA: TonB-dependent receptor [Vicinamibacterales bacterium]